MDIKSVTNQFGKLKPEVNVGTLRPFLPYLVTLLAIFLLFSMLSFKEGQFGRSENLFGGLGYMTAFILFAIFGKSALIFASLVFFIGLVLFKNSKLDLSAPMLAIPMVIIPASILFGTFDVKIESLKSGGGYAGLYIGDFLELLTGKSGKILISSVIMLWGILILYKLTPIEFVQKYFEEQKKQISQLGLESRQAVKKAKSLNMEQLKQKLKAKEQVNPTIEKQTIVETSTSKIKSFIDSKISNLSQQTKAEVLPWIEIRKVIASEQASDVFEFKKNIDENITTAPQEEFQTEVQTITREFDPESQYDQEDNKQETSYYKSLDENTEYDTIYLKPDKNLDKVDSIIEEVTFGSSGNQSNEDVDRIQFHKAPDSLIKNIEKDVLDKSQNIYEDIQTREKNEFLIPEDIRNRIFTAESKVQAPVVSELVVEEQKELSLPNEESTEIVLTKTEQEPIKEEYTQEKKEIVVQKQSNLFPPSTMSSGSVKKKTKPYYITHQVFKTNLDRKIMTSFYNQEMQDTGNRVIEILQGFNYRTRIIGNVRGPNITRYEIEPMENQKVDKATSLDDELKLFLAVKSIRIATVPGKVAIGIEIPNKSREDVYLGDILKETGLVSGKNDGELKIVIGKDISGKNVIIELNKLPHLLIAGTTGSGKSVSMNSMIVSLMVSKSPEDVRFVMIDPKMVEFALYEHIPHLLMPVITDPRKASKALAWAVQEMDSRYSWVSELKSRDLKSYNEKAEELQRRGITKYQKLPFIVIFIDELSDLMMISGKDLEDYITRISQKARAVGIHLVMATQRPSVDVITGLIKANCPARLAFHVAQKTDSKIILDYSGADSLIGKGDCLYKSPTSSDLQRIQAPYISEEEIEKIVTEARKYGNPEYVDIVFDEDSNVEENDDQDEESFNDAWEIVRTERKASASYLQRRLRIGYNKAARLMEMMEERGYVGPQIGSKPREILR